MATLAAAMLTACNNDENDVIDTGSSQATFTAAIDGQVNTRAYDQTWEAGDAIGISGTSGNTTYTNVQYVTTGGDGNFTVGTSGNEIYYQDDSPVFFTAYYPWNNLAVDATTITADTRAQASQKTFDFLYTPGTFCPGIRYDNNFASSWYVYIADITLPVYSAYAALSDGNITLTRDEATGIYAVDCNLEDSYGHQITGTWTGEIMAQ